MSTLTGGAASAVRPLIALIVFFFLLRAPAQARADEPAAPPPAATAATPVARVPLVAVESASQNGLRVLSEQMLKAAEGQAAAPKDSALEKAAKSRRAVAETRREDKEAFDRAILACTAAARAYFEAETGECEADCSEAAGLVCRGERKAGKGVAGAAGAAALGGVAWQAAVVNGLADFLSQRADRELVLWLSAELSAKLCASGESSGSPAAGTSLRPRDLFPSTCELLGSKDAPAAAESGSLLAAAIRADLALIPSRVAAHATKIDLDVVDTVRALLLEMSKGVAPLEALSGLSESDALEKKCESGTGSTKALACALRLLGLAARYSGDALAGELSGAELQKFVATLKAACGASCAQAVIDEKTAQAFLDAVTRFATAVRGQRSQQGTSAAERAAVVVAATLDVLDAGLGFFPKESAERKAWASIEPALRSTVFFLRGEAADGLQAIASVLRSLDAASEKPAWKDFIRLSSLVADIASARESKQVQAALEAAAAPVGSWRDKRRGVSLTATGLVGLSLGAEVPLDTAGGQRSAYAAGAPVGLLGLDLSGPVGSSSTFGVFFSLLDVGQLVTLPLHSPAGKTTDGTTQAPEINDSVRLSQVLSPGLFLKFGLGSSPLVFGAGMSYAPDLRSYLIRDVAAQEERPGDVVGMLRVHAFLAVDVTILPLVRVGR